jgi:deaminated glutathione amidase
MRVAAVQLCCGSDVSLNLRTCSDWVQRAAKEGAGLVVLPENFAYLGPERSKLEWVEDRGDLQAPIQGALAEMARSNGVYVVGGGMPQRSDDPARPHNAAVLFSPAGELIASYKKIHLFDIDLADGTAFTESSNTKPGDEPVVAVVGGRAGGRDGAESDELTLGMSICYDIRFPELYRRLADLGADVALAPAAFTAKTGRAHWHVLLRARAIESQMYVVAAAQWGKHPAGRESYGHSLIIDPWGTILAEAEDGVGVITAEVSRQHLLDIRRQLPALLHRRM